LKALQIDRTGEHDRTHDLVRLYHELDVPTEFRTLLEHLNPADTAARYPDADEIDLDRPTETLAEVGELPTWIRTRSNE
jgi:HEPN domain-containing protein